MAADTLRLDKYLWFARLSRQRRAARALAEDGHLRISGRVADRAHSPVRVGDVLSFALGGRVRVIRVEALPDRRGDAAAAARCYTDLSPDTRVAPTSTVDFAAPSALAGSPKGAPMP